MDKNSFQRVLIRDSPVFATTAHCKQAPAWFQLVVALDRFGNYGTGASLSRSKRLWGIGKGTADDYTDRVVCAWRDVSSDGQVRLNGESHHATWGAWASSVVWAL